MNDDAKGTLIAIGIVAVLILLLLAMGNEPSPSAGPPGCTVTYSPYGASCE